MGLGPSDLVGQAFSDERRESHERSESQEARSADSYRAEGAASVYVSCGNAVITDQMIAMKVKTRHAIAIAMWSMRSFFSGSRMSDVR